MPIATPAQVAKTIAAIRHLHRIGVKSRTNHPGHLPTGSWKKEAAKAGLHPDTFGKARVLADPDRGYTEDELDDLYRLCRKHGTAFGSSHVIKLLTVPNKAQRLAVQTEAVIGKWSQARLYAELKKRFGRRRTVGGQKPIVPVDVNHACVQITDLCARWKRWFNVISETTDPDAKPVFEQLKPALRRQLEATLESLEKLEKAAAKRLPPSGEER